MGTLGELFLNNDAMAQTVEQPNNGNMPFASCVPAGLYELVNINSPRYGDTVCLYNPDLNVVLGERDQRNRLTRWGCLVHPANKASQLQGCIALGDGLGFLDGEWCVTNSRTTTERLMPLLRKEKYVLIKDVE